MKPRQPHTQHRSPAAMARLDSSAAMPTVGGIGDGPTRTASFAQSIAGKYGYRIGDPFGQLSLVFLQPAGGARDKGRSGKYGRTSWLVQLQLQLQTLYHSDAPKLPFLRQTLMQLIPMQLRQDPAEDDTSKPIAALAATQSERKRQQEQVPRGGTTVHWSTGAKASLEHAERPAGAKRAEPRSDSSVPGKLPFWRHSISKHHFSDDKQRTIARYNPSIVRYTSTNMRFNTDLVHDVRLKSQSKQFFDNRITLINRKINEAAPLKREAEVTGRQAVEPESGVRNAVSRIKPDNGFQTFTASAVRHDAELLHQPQAAEDSAMRIGQRRVIQAGTKLDSLPQWRWAPPAAISAFERTALLRIDMEPIRAREEKPVGALIIRRRRSGGRETNRPAMLSDGGVPSANYRNLRVRPGQIHAMDEHVITSTHTSLLAKRRDARADNGNLLGVKHMTTDDVGSALMAAHGSTLTFRMARTLRQILTHSRFHHAEQNTYNHETVSQRKQQARSSISQANVSEAGGNGGAAIPYVSPPGIVRAVATPQHATGNRIRSSEPHGPKSVLHMLEQAIQGIFGMRTERQLFVAERIAEIPAPAAIIMRRPIGFADWIAKRIREREPNHPKKTRIDEQRRVAAQARSVRSKSSASDARSDDLPASNTVVQGDPSASHRATPALTLSLRRTELSEFIDGIAWKRHNAELRRQAQSSEIIQIGDEIQRMGKPEAGKRPPSRVTSSAERDGKEVEVFAKGAHSVRPIQVIGTAQATDDGSPRPKPSDITVSASRYLRRRHDRLFSASEAEATLKAKRPLEVMPAERRLSGTRRLSPETMPRLPAFNPTVNTRSVRASLTKRSIRTARTNESNRAVAHEKSKQATASSFAVNLKPERFIPSGPAETSAKSRNRAIPASSSHPAKLTGSALSRSPQSLTFTKSGDTFGSSVYSASTASSATPASKELSASTASFAATVSSASPASSATQTSSESPTSAASPASTASFAPPASSASAASHKSVDSIASIASAAFLRLARGIGHTALRSDPTFVRRRKSSVSVARTDSEISEMRREPKRQLQFDIPISPQQRPGSEGVQRTWTRLSNASPLVIEQLTHQEKDFVSRSEEADIDGDRGRPASRWLRPAAEASAAPTDMTYAAAQAMAKASVNRPSKEAVNQRSASVAIWNRSAGNVGGSGIAQLGPAKAITDSTATARRQRSHIIHASVRNGSTVVRRPASPIGVRQLMRSTLERTIQARNMTTGGNHDAASGSGSLPSASNSALSSEERRYSLEHKIVASEAAGRPHEQHGAAGNSYIPPDFDWLRRKPAVIQAEPASAQPEETEPQINILQLQEIIKKLPQLDVKKLADRVYREIEKKMRFDRQTRGL